MECLVEVEDVHLMGMAVEAVSAPKLIQDLQVPKSEEELEGGMVVLARGDQREIKELVVVVVAISAEVVVVEMRKTTQAAVEDLAIACYALLRTSGLILRIVQMDLST